MSIGWALKECFVLEELMEDERGGGAHFNPKFWRFDLLIGVAAIMLYFRRETLLV